MTIRALVYDIDDTLTATSSANKESRRRTLEFVLHELGCGVDSSAVDIERRLYEVFGWSKLHDLWRALALELELPQPPEALIEDAQNLFENTFFDSLGLLPTVDATLTELKERWFPLGIISDGDEDLQWRKLRSTGLNRYFKPGKVIVTIQSDLYSAKPSSANFRRMEKLLGFSGRELAYVGDRPWDVAAANVAGWTSIRTRQALRDQRNDWPKRQMAVHKPDVEISTFAELLELI